MSEKTANAFTWPAEPPASISAHAAGTRQALYFNDRILIRMDPGWTQFETRRRAIGYRRKDRHAGSALLRWTILAKKWTRSRARK